MDPVPLVTDLARQGAARVFQECLHLLPGDSVAIFHDDSSPECAAVLIEMARALALDLFDRYVPLESQIRYCGTPVLDPNDSAAIDGCRAVLICLSPTHHSLAFRKALVRAAVDDSRFVGMVPGATVSLLTHAVNIDYNEVTQRCDDLAYAMLLGEHAVLTTYAAEPSADTLELRLNLGGFGRSPITSTGVIEKGTWGNLPGGETFIAPLEDSATGSFLLNGAFTGQVLHGTPIRLEFDGGFLNGISGVPPQVLALQDLIGWDPAVRNRSCLGLAELGIGVNSGIPALTGNALFDEKKEGTAHIAIGDNSIYGGVLLSSMHEDFITLGPTLTIDGRFVLDHGRYVLNPREWREDWSTAAALARSIPGDCLTAKRPIHANVDSSLRLRVRRDVGARRTCIYTVGSPELQKALGIVYSALPPIPEAIGFRLLMEWCRERGVADESQVRGVLGVLARHELVSCFPSDE